MKVEIFIIINNHEKVLPLFLNNCKENFSDYMINIYDNQSTDSGPKLCKEAGCNVTDIVLNQPITKYWYEEQELKNTIWKESSADWIMVCDPDELVQIKESDLKDINADVIKFKGYQMLRYNNKSSFNELTCGYRDGQYDKTLMFRPTIDDINFTPGSHNAEPAAKWKIKESDREYKLLHYKEDRMNHIGRFSIPIEVVKGEPGHPYPFTVTERGSWIVDVNYPLYKFGWDPPLAEELDSFFKKEKVTRIADFGCGDAAFVKYFTSKKYDVDGYDGNPHASCNLVDLSEPIILDKKYDWIISFEVGEHIPKKYEDVFIQNLHNNSKKGIILTWALPNQLSVGHVNCQESQYIRNKFLQLGYKNDLLIEHDLRKACKNHWLQESLMVFRKN